MRYRGINRYGECPAELKAKSINLFTLTFDNYTKIASEKLKEHNTKLPIRGVSFALDVMGKKRTLEILYFLRVKDKIRFNRLRKMMGAGKAPMFGGLEIGPRMLSLRLKKLGIVERKAKPPYVEYSLTARGKELELPMVMLCWWIIRYNQTSSSSSR